VRKARAFLSSDADKPCEVQEVRRVLVVQVEAGSPDRHYRGRVRAGIATGDGERGRSADGQGP
jgi:hypothetical protein